MSFGPPMSNLAKLIARGAPVLLGLLLLLVVQQVVVAAPRMTVGPLPQGEIASLAPRTAEARYCGGVGYVDLGSAVDGPAYYFRRSDGKVLGHCGGYCMMRNDECAHQCPPKSWTCGRPPALVSPGGKVKR